MSVSTDTLLQECMKEDLESLRASLEYNNIVCSRLLEDIWKYIKEPADEASGNRAKVARVLAALKLSLPDLMSGSPERISAGLLTLAADLNALLTPDAYKGLVATVLAVVGHIIGSNNGGDKLLLTIETALKKYHRQVIKEKINGLMVELKHAKARLDQVSPDGLDEEDLHLIIDNAVPTQIGVGFLGMLAQYMQEDVENATSKAGALSTLDIADAFCSLMIFRLLILSRKFTIFMAMNKTQAAKIIEADIMMGLGEDRRNELQFVVRPRMPAGLLIASYYRPDKWPYLRTYLGMINLQEPEPDAEVNFLQVQGYRTAYLALAGKHIGMWSLVTFSPEQGTYELGCSTSGITKFRLEREGYFYKICCPLGNGDCIHFVQGTWGTRISNTRPPTLLKPIFTSGDNPLCLLASAENPELFLKMVPQRQAGKRVLQLCYYDSWLSGSKSDFFWIIKFWDRGKLAIASEFPPGELGILDMLRESAW